MVITKLSQQTSPAKSYEPELLSQYLPAGVPLTPSLMALAPASEPVGGPEIPVVTENEMKGAVDYLRRNKKAPEPDSVPSRVLPVAFKHPDD